MLHERRISWPGFHFCCVALLLVCQTASAQSGTRTGSAMLLDFEDDLQFTRLRVGDYAKVEPSSDAHAGKRAARIVFSAVPEGVREFPAVIVEGDGLRIRNLTPFEAIGLWVFNPGIDDAELSLAIWDKDGNRAFPLPSTFTIKPGKWQQQCRSSPTSSAWIYQSASFLQR